VNKISRFGVNHKQQILIVKLRLIFVNIHTTKKMFQKGWPLKRKELKLRLLPILSKSHLVQTLFD